MAANCSPRAKSPKILPFRTYTQVLVQVDTPVSYSKRWTAPKKTKFMNIYNLCSEFSRRLSDDAARCKDTKDAADGHTHASLHARPAPQLIMLVLLLLLRFLLLTSRPAARCNGLGGLAQPGARARVCIVANPFAVGVCGARPSAHGPAGLGGHLWESGGEVVASGMKGGEDGWR